MTRWTRRDFARLAALAGGSLVLPGCSGLETFAAPPADDGAPLEAARLTIDPSRRLDEISPLLFGSGIEWIDHGNGICDPETGDLRARIVDLLRPLRLPVVRFPGGILADHYHWRDGVGERARRPVRRNPMDGTEHANTFGTDEYIRFLQAIGADALVTANVGTGTYDELSEWRRYFERQHAPVTYWELGNEIYLAEPREKASIPGNDARIYKTPADYAATARDWAAGLRAAAPQALVGGIAGTGNVSAENRGWLETLIDRAAPSLDFVALHDAFAPLIQGRYDYGDARRREAAYQAMFAQALDAAEDAARVRDLWQAAVPARPARVAVTEHFPLFGTGGSQSQLLQILDQSRTMAAALYTASLLHGWMREGVWMAAYNLTVSRWFGALVTDTPDGLVRTPTYHVLDLYRNRFGTRRVSVTAAGPAFTPSALGTGRARAVPYLDAVAAIDPRGGLTVAIVNRRVAGPVAATLTGLRPGAVEVLTLAASSPDAINGPALTPTTAAHADIEPRRSAWTYAPETTYTFPPTSVTLLRWPAP
jgi:alpha-N-arabinofuranosidase